MVSIVRRLLDLDLPKGKSAFLWGPRKVGKSHWIREHLPSAVIIDLLETDTYAEYAVRPALLRERFAGHDGIVVIDEVQKIPSLLDEVHWLMERTGAQFILTGSSARKLRRGHANLLGGRAWRRVMVPLCSRELSEVDLPVVLRSGLLPPHVLSPKPEEDLRAYIADYLREEIATEAKEENIPAFAEFLRIAALTSSELLNYTNIGREAGVSPKIVRRYLEILEDTHLGVRLPPWKASRTRRLIQAEKFYFFDVGVANALSRRHPIPGSPDFGKAFEHFIFMELRAFQVYRAPDMPLAYWRTAGGSEVDFIVGDKQLAVEVKGKAKIHDGDLTGLRALPDDGPVRHRIVVSMESLPRTLSDGIEILPWHIFLDRLWNGDFALS